MHYVKFDDINSYDDLNLLLSDYVIPPATPKINLIELEGRDDPIDATEATGRVHYNKRPCSWEFTMLDDDYVAKRQQVSNLLNGKRCKITMYDDPDYYYIGRLSVSDYARDRTVNKITITSDVQPFKLKQDVTSVSWTIAKTKNLADRLNLWKSYNANTQSGFVSNDVASITPVSGGNRYIYTNISLSGDEKALSISCDTKNQYIRCFFTFRDSSGIAISSDALILVDGKFEGLTVPENAKSLWFRVYPHVNYGKVVFSKIQIEVGTSVTDYVPKDGFLIANDRKPVIPTITVTDNNTEITVNNKTVTFSAGEHQILDFELSYGESIINASGSGTITFVYQEGSL